ncbi:MAG: FtsX-like permease family protein [Campylobacterota bacterium]|nr:FtsX-like permease family protein [Campylobacterota bacterium]
MQNKLFFNFLFLLLYKHRVKHLSIFFISTLIVFILSSVMLVSNALQEEIDQTLDAQPDFIIQKMRSGKSVNTPVSWADEFQSIEGISQAQTRIYGQYFFNPNGEYFTIVGIDFFEQHNSDKLQKVISDIDMKSFLAKPNMIIGQGVKALLDKYHFFEYYIFKTPNRSKLEVTIYDTFTPESSLLSNDVIIMDIDLAREILSISEDESTDIALYSPNELEADNIYIKLVLKHFDIRVIQKSDIAKAYERLFNYKGGLFLILYMIVLLTFMMILYQRYSMVQSSDKKEIGILRALGWSIKDVIILKITESFMLALGAFLIGFIFAFIYVFFLDAPLLSSIFYGYSNLPTHIALAKSIDFSLLSLLFLFYILPFMAAVLIPSWRASVIDPLEAMR